MRRSTNSSRTVGSSTEVNDCTLVSTMVLMKRLIVFVSLFLAAMIAAPVAHAVTPEAGTTSSQAMSPEQIAQLRDAARNLSKALGNDDTGTAKEKTEEHKTTADVADKALTLFSGMLGTVSEAFKKIAPEVWRIMIKQQYATAAAMVIIPFGLFAACLVIYYTSRNKEGDFNEAMMYVGRVGAMCCGIALAISMGCAAARLINPEYYAIKDMLSLVDNHLAELTIMADREELLVLC